MERLRHTPRFAWEQKVEAQGFVFHSLEGPYWDESIYYCFSAQEALLLQSVTNELHARCLDAVDYVIKHSHYDRFGISAKDAELIKRSWQKQERSLYGRFDLRYDGISPPKLLEYNADTPTSLLEAAKIQRLWCEEMFGDTFQFNTIHEYLINTWGELDIKSQLHFSAVAGSVEDKGNIEYLCRSAMEAGLSVNYLDVEHVAWNEDAKYFVDQNNEQIETWFKLYPWEWLVEEQFGEYLRKEPMRLIEPAWKMILSNKAILPILWELFPNHPNLLPAYTTPEKLGDTFVRKPIHGREGANVAIQLQDRSVYLPGPYAKEPVIYQEFCPLPCFDGKYLLVGSWVIGGRSAGIGLRESTRLISENRSLFVPHVVM